MRSTLSDISRRIVAPLLAAALLFALPASGVAAPTNAEIEQKQAEAAEAEEHLDELQAQLELRAEEYGAIDEQLQQTRGDVVAAREDLEQANRNLSDANGLLSGRAEGIYRTGGVAMLEVLLETQSFQDLLTRMEFLRRVNASDAELVESVKVARERVEADKNALERREAEQVRLRHQAEAKRTQVEEALDEQSTYVSGLNAEVARLIEEERKRQEALAAERARKAAEAARLAAERAGAAGAAGRTPSSAPGYGHPEAVAEAMKYIGVPYVWGGTTPKGFDCSGLTQYVYREIGISIPRTSRSQFRAGDHVAPGNLDQLVPGDLVFFGYGGDPGRVHHVGIYVGDGDFIHAPARGQKVRIDSLTSRIERRGDYVGASRF